MEAVAQGTLSLVEAVVVVEALGRDEDLVALEARGVDGLPDGGLVAVGRGGVDVAIAREQGAGVASVVSSGGTWKTPKPSWGISMSPRRGTVGTWLVEKLILLPSPV